MRVYSINIEFLATLLDFESFQKVKTYYVIYLSSLRAESARAVTGRRCPHSGEGEDFLRRQPGFFLRKQLELRNGKSKNCSQGQKLTVMPRAKNGSLTKIGVVWQKSDFWTKNRNFGPKKRHLLFARNHVLATTGKSCSKKKSAFAQIIKGGNVIFG